MTLSIVLKPIDLLSLPDGTRLLFVDLSTEEQYLERHIPGAIYLEYNRIVRAAGKANGLLPEADVFAGVLAEHGINDEVHVLAYDQNGGGAASRLIWTLHAFGLFNCSLLAGGLKSWLASGQISSTQREEIRPVDAVVLSTDRHNVMNTDDLMAELEKDTGQLKILDARSEKEYLGTDVRSARGGHVPGAIHLEWTKALDKQRNLELLPEPELRELVESHGFEPKHRIVSYCQTHQRSSLSYVMLKHLGYDHVLGLEGAWSEWGNREDTPVES